MAIASPAFLRWAGGGGPVGGAAWAAAWACRPCLLLPRQALPGRPTVVGCPNFKKHRGPSRPGLVARPVGRGSRRHCGQELGGLKASWQVVGSAAISRTCSRSRSSTDLGIVRRARMRAQRGQMTGAATFVLATVEAPTTPTWRNTSSGRQISARARLPAQEASRWKPRIYVADRHPCLRQHHG